MVEKYMKYRVEGVRPRGRPKKARSGLVEKDSDPTNVISYFSAKMLRLLLLLLLFILLLFILLLLKTTVFNAP